MNKKKVITLLVATAGIISLSSCRKKNPDLSSNVTKYEFPGSGYVGNDYFAVRRPLVKLAVGESQTIDVESYPADFANKNLVFTSKDPSIVTVNALGVLTGVAKGTADVEIKSTSGEELGKVRVAVASPTTASAAAEVIADIKADYAASEKPTKILQYEYSYEYYKKEGEIVTGSESAEVMAYDSEEGYFYVEGPSLSYKTRLGAPEISEGKWVFYTIQEGLFTRFLHITATSKKFYDLNTANYTSNDRIIRDIINFFFVSGEKIITQLVNDYYGKDNFESLAENDRTTLYSVNNSSLYYSYLESGSDKVSADDEINYYNIPTDTQYTYTFREDVLNKGPRVGGVDIDMEMRYQLNGENWSRVFNRRKIFDNTFEETKVKDPDDNTRQ